MRTLGWILAVALVVAAGLAFFALDFPRQPSNDMAPCLRKGDLVLACRVCGAPRLGDVVLFSVPEHPAELSLRRVVAMPGDRVEVVKGRVLVNGAPLAAERTGTLSLDGMDDASPGPRSFEVTVEDAGAHHYRTVRDSSTALAGDRAAETLNDAYFLVADRRTFAADSREYGPVPRKNIRSRALRVLSAGDADASRQTRLP
jgi:signal peptidase I